MHWLLGDQEKVLAATTPSTSRSVCPLESRMTTAPSLPTARYFPFGDQDGA
jgi:hypothetical protein